MTGGVCMRKASRWLVAMVVCVVSLSLQAQDEVPSLVGVGRPTRDAVQTREWKLSPDTIPLHVALPTVFMGTGKNYINDPACVLDSVMEHFRLLQEGASEDSVRIVHIGDSHVRGHIYPQTTGKKLVATFGAVAYTDMGINGATCLTFTHPGRIESIVELKPELLILSFGTNESHNLRYNADAHYRQMDELVALLRKSLPEVPILLTTPPGSYVGVRQSRRRRTYTINPRTELAVQTIGRFATKHGLALWDMYAAVGGAKHACTNWQAAQMLRPDHVHYTPEGYMLQGELLYDALIKTYNEYVSRSY